jgi:hypothetical protein
VWRPSRQRRHGHNSIAQTAKGKERTREHKAQDTNQQQRRFIRKKQLGKNGTLKSEHHLEEVLAVGE